MDNTESDRLATQIHEIFVDENARVSDAVMAMLKVQVSIHCRMGCVYEDFFQRMVGAMKLFEAEWPIG